MGVKPPTAGGRDDIPEYEANMSNNANHPSYVAASRNGPMYGNLDNLLSSDEDEDNNNNNNSVVRSSKASEDYEEDGDEEGGDLMLYTMPPHPPAPPVPSPEYLDYEFNLLARRPPPPRNIHPNFPCSHDGYLLPVEQRHL